MEIDNNGQCADEIKHIPVDEDCDKWIMDDKCQECSMLIECYEVNGYEIDFETTNEKEV